MVQSVILLLLLTACSTVPCQNMVEKTVTFVGDCDRENVCEVTYEDGTESEHRQPMIGEKYKVCK